ncbi:hypothetical protein Mal52_05820 [Symmachiella dynata]|uniref:Uncharacterized protein n=1 Tax=Symmachiella dynata TaxID=2527995 RepID=A0A517ZI27_9PLAN|nr:hypothetical protein Mal52_05820 [Symmachiella dynata]
MRPQAVGLGLVRISLRNLCLICVQSVAKKITATFDCGSVALRTSLQRRLV